MSQTSTTTIDTFIQQCCDDDAIAGAVTWVWHRGQTVHESAIGMMDIEAGRPMQVDTIFRIASMTKPITAVAVLTLVDEECFSLDDPISAFFPEFAVAHVAIGNDDQGIQLIDSEHEVTIRHLLTHTSGMGLGAGGDEPIEALWSDAVAGLMGTPGTTLQSAVRALAKLPLASQPGTAWRYGLSFEALAALVKVVSGEWFDQFLEHRVFEPLGMVDSGYVIQPQNAKRLSALYGRDEDGGLKLIEAPAQSPHVLLHSYESGTGWTTGGDMLVSTVADYGRFLQMLLNGGELDGVRLLRPETVAQMRTNWLSSNLMKVARIEPGYGQGLAVRVLLDAISADGAGSTGRFTHAGGHGTHFWVDPAEELIGLLMLQLNPVPTSIFQRFQALTYQMLADAV